MVATDWRILLKKSTLIRLTEHVANITLSQHNAIHLSSVDDQCGSFKSCKPYIYIYIYIFIYFWL